MKKLYLFFIIVIIGCSHVDHITIDGTYNAIFNSEYIGTPSQLQYDITFEIKRLERDSIECIATTFVIDTVINDGGSRYVWNQVKGNISGNQIEIVFGTPFYPDNKFYIATNAFNAFKRNNFNLTWLGDKLIGNYNRQYIHNGVIVTIPIHDNVIFKKIK